MGSILWSEKSWFISGLILFSVLSRKAFSYPEVHFVLAKGLSLISRRSPEIVFDAPWRCRKGELIPITCIVNDAHKYPIELLDAKAQIFGEGLELEYSLFNRVFDEAISSTYLYRKPKKSKAPWHRNSEFGIRNSELEKTKFPNYQISKLPINTPYWYVMDYIQLPDDLVGPIAIHPQMKFSLRGKRKIASTDNLPGLSHSPLRMYIAKDPLPTFDGWYYGDAHWHSDKTKDQVEFAAPVDVAASFAKAIGLHWFTVTDHSYDLDAPLNDYFAIDPDLTKWNDLHKEIESINAQFDNLVVLRGEEVSCGNSKGQNVHLLVYGVPEFIPGRGDSGKTGFDFKFKPDFSIQEVLEIVKDHNGVAYAAHPNADNSFLGRIVLNRGTWLDDDCKMEGCSGLQFWNGCSGQRFVDGYKRWVRLLLDGEKRYIIAGSDAHGDFNRTRKMKFPWVKLLESMDSSFGKPRTCLYCGSNPNEDNILDAMRCGRAVITDGPLAIFNIKNEHGQEANIGETISGNQFEITLQVKSTEEFGRLSKAVLYRGNPSQKLEEIELEINLKRTKDDYAHFSKHSMKSKSDCYFRLEVTSQEGERKHRCITNPIWVSRC